LGGVMLYNIKIWYLGMSYCKEHHDCDKFKWYSDRLITFTAGNAEHIVPLYNVDDVEVTEEV
jgi:hypothetical protein